MMRMMMMMMRIMIRMKKIKKRFVKNKLSNPFRMIQYRKIIKNKILIKNNKKIVDYR